MKVDPNRKEKIHSVKHAIKPDGTVDVDKAISHTQHAFGQLKNNHYRLENVVEKELEPGRVSIYFERVEVNPKEEAHEASVQA